MPSERSFGLSIGMASVAFGALLMVNTSFNVKDEPMVCTPDDAYHCFMNTGMDVLVMESFVMTKHAGRSRSATSTR